jgi:hypothetical protein
MRRTDDRRTAEPKRLAVADPAPVPTGVEAEQPWQMWPVQLAAIVPRMLGRRLATPKSVCQPHIDESLLPHPTSPIFGQLLVAAISLPASMAVVPIEEQTKITMMVVVLAVE